MAVQSSWLVRVAVAPLVVVALAGGLAGCKGVVAASSPAGTVPGTASVAAEASEPEPSAAASGTGSVAVAITSPVAVSGSVAAPVSCVTGLAYRATVSGAVVRGDQLSFSVTVPRYRGPGDYPAAVVGVTLRQASGTVTAVAGVSRVPAVISDSGGSFSVSATGGDGRTLTGVLRWTCGS